MFVFIYSSRIKDQKVIENAVDIKKKSLQRLLSAIEESDRRVSAEALQEKVHEKGKTKKQYSLPLVTHCSKREARQYNLNHVIALKSRISHAPRF